MPLDSAPTISPDVREKLLTAATLLRKHGRCKFTMSDLAGRICLMNALAYAASGGFLEVTGFVGGYSKAEELGKQIGLESGFDIYDFNNKNDDATVLARLEGVH